MTSTTVRRTIRLVQQLALEHVPSAIWLRSDGYDPAARALAERHYTRQSHGAPQFVLPGRRLVLLTPCARALWVVVAQRFVLHAWPGAWVCSLFRNEGAGLSSELVREATIETVRRWGRWPHLLITMIDVEATRRGRSKRSLPGACFRHAGWTEIGWTVGAEGSGRGAPKLVLRAPEPTC